MTSPTLGWLVRKSAIRSALSQCRSIRTASVLSPRWVRKQSNGPGTAPIAFWWKPTFSATSRSRTTSAPPTTSEWPPTYLVVLCTTTSAPRRSGCWRYGDANVLSTTSSAPASWATAASASMSPIDEQRVGRGLDPDQRGLAGPDRGADRVDVVDRRRAVGQPPRHRDLVEEPEGAAVRVVRDDRVVARAGRAPAAGCPRRRDRRRTRSRAPPPRPPPAPLRGRSGWGSRCGCTRSRRAGRRPRPACTSRSRRWAGSPLRSSGPARSPHGWRGSRSHSCCDALGSPGRA